METRYCYLHDNQKKRHVAVARRFDKQNKVVMFAFSVSHPSDTFRKKLGRTIAENRLDSGKGYGVHVPEGMSPMQCVMAFFAWSNDYRVPNAVKKMAQGWFDADLRKAMSMELSEQYKEYLVRQDGQFTAGEDDLPF